MNAILHNDLLFSYIIYTVGKRSWNCWKALSQMVKTETFKARSVTSGQEINGSFIKLREFHVKID